MNSKIDGGEITFEVLDRQKQIWKPLSSDLLKGKILTAFIEDGPFTVKIKGNGRIIVPQISMKRILK